jgi:hypothetical protein
LADAALVDGLSRLGGADRRGPLLIPFDPLFPEEAEAALEVFRGLRLVDVAGPPDDG